MSFELNTDSIVAGKPAIASDLNNNFSSIFAELNQLGENSTFKSGSIEADHIETGAVTVSKIDLTGASEGTHPASRAYADSVVLDGLGNLLGASTIEDDNSDPIRANYAWVDEDVDKYDYYLYEATEDGFLTVISKEINDPWIVIMASLNLDELKHARIGRTHGNPVRGYMGVDGTEQEYPQSVIRAEQFYQTNDTNTAVISAMSIIRKGEHFKIHCIQNTKSDAEEFEYFEKCIYIPMGATGSITENGTDAATYTS